MSRNPHSYGAIVLLRQLGERGSSHLRQTPLYYSPPGEEKECNTPQPLSSCRHLSIPENMPHLSPLHWSHLPLGRRFLPSSPWGRTSDPSSLSQAGGTGMDISLLDTRGNPQRTPSSCEPCHILLWPAKNTCPSPCTYKGRLYIPSTMRASTRNPASYTFYSEREGKTGAFLWVSKEGLLHEEVIPAQERGSCTRKHPPTRQAVAQKEHPLETSCCSRGCHGQGYTARRGCCRRRGRKLLHEEGRCTSGAPGTGYAQEAFCSLGSGLSRSWRGAPLGWRWC